MATATVKFSPVVSDSGHFKGYGAVFGNADSHRDVINRGAFTASLDAWRAKGRWPAMKLQHGTAINPFNGDDLPIGRWLSMREDINGLWVEGQLLALDTDQGRRLLSLMKGGVLDGLSIGYHVEDHKPGTGRIARYLTRLTLKEVSIVDEPSNDLARMEPMSPTEAAADKVRAALVAAGLGGGKSAHDVAFDRLKEALQKL
jgi:HK97 family phage prohead protease